MWRDAPVELRSHFVFASHVVQASDPQAAKALDTRKQTDAAAKIRKALRSRLTLLQRHRPLAGSKLTLLRHHGRISPRTQSHMRASASGARPKRCGSVSLLPRRPHIFAAAFICFRGQRRDRSHVESGPFRSGLPQRAVRASCESGTLRQRATRAAPNARCPGAWKRRGTVPHAGSPPARLGRYFTLMTTPAVNVEAR